MAPSLPGPVRAAGRLSLLAGAASAAVTGAVLSASSLLPPPSWSVWQYALLAAEFGLLVAVLAGTGLLLSLLARRRRCRSRAVATAAALANAAVLAGALLPASSAWKDARASGTELSLRGYFAGLATGADREPTTVRYARLGGTDLELDVWQPARRHDRRPLPVVVNVHGGAEDLPQSLLPRWDAWLADLGYVVFDVDYRIAPPGGWRVPAADLKCALGWIAAHATEYGADPDRIAVMGQSAGGLATLLAAYTGPGPIAPSCPAGTVPVRAVAAWYSITDMTAPEVPWRQRHSPIGDELAEATRTMMGGTSQERPGEYRAASPISHVRPGLPPTLLIQGGRDLFVPVQDNRRFAARLARAGVPHRLVGIGYADHMFDLNWGGFASQLTRQEIARFLRERL
ncbi:alpha/beta hydrolase fold domain-containing protein [Actinomadura sp. 21ATH]|uniref:alpha/beta hydrolase fold domain-containing protein n=1 Tax=Actinomadura sp. 21ATH TaxID=1735444 RepID=UPI0035BFC39D